MPQVFISYSHRDKQVARLIAQKLEARDVGVWIDEQDLKPGADIASSIRAGLEHSDTIVLILGAAEYGDSWAKREAALALSQKHKRLIPVLASRDADVPYIIRHLNQVDLSDPARAEASAEKLALFLSQPWDGAEGIGSARSDTAQVVTEALHEEIVAYAADRATANIRIIAGATATAIVVGVLAFVLFWLPQEFDGISKYLSVLVGVLTGIAGNFMARRLTNYFAQRAQSKAEAKSEQH